MSREERRNYERMMKSMERGPALPPAAKARAERTAARRTRARATAAITAPPGSFTTRFWVRSLVIAAAAAFIAFSFQWPQMPFALYVGLIVFGVILLVLVGFRLLKRRAATRS